MHNNGWVKGYDKKTGEHTLNIHLTPKGIKAHDNGEKTTWEDGHFDCAVDARLISLVDF